MKYAIALYSNKFYKIALTITLFSTIQAFEGPQTNKDSGLETQQKSNDPEKSYWQSYAPQFMQNVTSSSSAYMASWIPEPIQAWVNSLSAGQKIAIASTALTGLLSFLSRDQIMQLVKDFLAPKAYTESNTTINQETAEPKKTQDLQRPVLSSVDENGVQVILKHMTIDNIEHLRSSIDERIRFVNGEYGPQSERNVRLSKEVLHRLAQEYADKYPELLPYK